MIVPDNIDVSGHGPIEERLSLLKQLSKAGVRN